MPKKKRNPYHSQFREDRWIHKHLQLPDKGVFVDVGASNGVKHSNTLFFENRGWTGLCIDADPRHWNELKANRKCTIECCAIAHTEGEAVLYQHKEMGSLSGLLIPDDPYSIRRYRDNPTYRQIEIATYRLDTLLDKHLITNIDLLSIDVEGSELDVWRSFNSEIYQPRAVIMEFNGNDHRAKILDTMNRCDYQIVGQTKANIIFTRK